MPRVIEAITPLAPEDLIFHAMTGIEALSTLFDFNVTLVSKQKDIAPKALLGRDITLAIETEQDGPKRHLSGRCGFAPNRRTVERRITTTRARYQ